MEVCFLSLPILRGIITYFLEFENVPLKNTQDCRLKNFVKNDRTFADFLLG